MMVCLAPCSVMVTLQHLLTSQMECSRVVYWPLFCSTCFSRFVLTHALRDLKTGIFIKYRLDGSLFDLRRLRTQTKSVERLIVEALFADDCALLAHSEADLQAFVNKFAEATYLFGLTISIKKTEVLHQSSPAQRLPSPSININGSELKNVDQFKYLGSIMSSDGTLSKEIESRISKASQSLGRLRSWVMDNRTIKLSTKLKVYKAVVLTSRLYGCETWTLYRKQSKQLEGFHMR